MTFKFTFIIVFVLVCGQCKPSTEPAKESVVMDKDLEKYLEETFFYYELMRNQPSILRDSIFELVALDLRNKYHLDTNRMNEFIKPMSASGLAYSQMLDSIKTRLKNASME
ncbi:MAG: hypothetical protein IPM92_06575 [Saprospiraceae bacterium]|nr:hypothetical protein [Saprospiraceae bacterium]